MMLQPVPFEAPDPGPETPLIQSFQPNGKPLYLFKDPTGHCPWDINCSCQGCQNDAFEDLDEEIRRSRRKKNKKKSTQTEFYERLWLSHKDFTG